ncbi:MAG TPA: o-succinylbenzoate synthase [Bryobacteraceae bacterium]|nr:o-succinylbenzoate synthase [Bryobacteraceae bacterium]
MAYRIKRVVLRQVRMPLVHFFETSFGRTYDRTMVLVEVQSEGLSGWGEVTAGEHPFYNEEWTASVWPLLRNYVARKLLDEPIESAGEVYDRTANIRGHFMARGGMEAAVWDLEARRAGVSLARHIGAGYNGNGPRNEIPCGVSIGIQDSVVQLIKKIAAELEAGYQRIKIKIKPGWDVDVVREVRGIFPSIRLMADANSAYTLADADRLRRLDDFNLTMIEQPLAHDDIIDHAKLQAQLQTPLCLDECIRTPRHAEQAIEMHACRIINIKLGRVGGFRQAKRIHDIAQAHGIPVWCGGMLESGIGRAHNIALSTLPNFTLPGDVSASKRYWKRDLVQPAIEVTARGTIEVPDGAGFGYEIDHDFLRSVTALQEVVA